MGNQLAGIAPSQIFPVEHYLTEINDIDLDSSLGSTRFFKVARAKSKEGLVVVKVFTIHDPSLPLKTYKEQLEDIRVQLSSATNCLPFQKAILTDKAGILIRQYVKDNLYDRISTRPFLNNIEKKWIAFQILCALNQCHKLKVCHGDIKTENVLVTSWNWLLLSDFASFKPTYLPEDNPADFSYFFDTSRRRTCYIAPERFVKTLSEMGTGVINSNLVLTDSEVKKGDLTPAVDIFSAGCVIAELFTEGHPPFDFSQLLAYRNGEYSPWKVLEKIEDTSIRELVRQMLKKDPNSRLSAEEYLIQQRGKAFPEYFYTFLKVYIQGFSTTPLQSADDKITRLKKDSGRILSSLSSDNNDNGGLVIIVSLITSCLRSLRFCDSKLHALQLLLEISGHLSSEIILDRLIPYMLFLINDTFPRVRADALKTLTKCLKLVKNVPRSDANIFPEYILPLLSSITQDEAVLVRIAFAETIAALADVALRFLEITQLHPSPQSLDTGHDGSTQYQASYDAELQALHEMIQQKVQTLLSDPDNIVKQTLLENGITQLCVFFGRQKANDILSHMITFLNDKHDWQLRGTFFDNIVGVAAYVGWHGSSILKPLLQQGLSDAEEFVMCKTLRAMTNLTELGLIQKPVLYELLTETAALLCHPNLWVRQGTVGFICAVARYLNIADVHCKLLPLIQPFLQQNIIQVDQEVVVLSVLKEPVSRSVYDYIVKSPLVNSLFDSMQDRQLIRNITRSGHKPNYTEVEDNLKQLYRKLMSQGMNESDEDKLLAMKEFIVKIHKAKTNLLEIRSPDEASRPGYINLAVIPALRRQVELVRVDSKQDLVSQSQSKKTKSRTNKLDSPTVIMNEEWQHMFGSMEPKIKENMMSQSLPQQGPALQDNLLNPNTPICMSQLQLSDSQQSPKRVFPNLEKSTQQIHFPPCKIELNALIQRKRAQYTEDLVSKELTINKLDGKSHPSGWRPKGHLVAHLHEHKSAVNRIRVNHENAFFATCSNDGTVKLWDCGRMEGKSVANRSRQTYKQGGQIKSFVFCQQNQSIACASDNGNIYVFRIENTVPHINVEISQTLDKEEEGCVVDMGYLDTGSQSIVTYATVHGYLFGWDLRSRTIAWKLRNDLRHGLITSYSMDSRQCWMVVGTSCGSHICWDMRFHLPITSLRHPTGARVRRLVMHPNQQSWVASAVQGNNEVSIWDMETAARQMTLWGSPSPPLSLTQASNHSTTSLFISQGEWSPFILSVSTDMKIRYWDLLTPARSYVIVAGSNDPSLNPSLATYMSRLIDGTEVIIESHKEKQSPASGVSEDIPRRGPDSPPTGHLDCISDMDLCQTTQTFIITASRDGVVKVWK